MAITLVGTASSGAANLGATGTLNIDFNSIAAVAGDFVVMALVGGTPTTDLSVDNPPAGNNSGVWNLAADLFANDTNCTNLFVWTSVLGASPDVRATVDVSGGSFTGTWVVRAYRGVDPDNPLDVAVATAIGTNADAANPDPLTPVTAGAKVAAIYAGSQQSSTLYGAPSNMSNFTQARVTTGTGGKHAIVAIGDADWTAGTLNPAVPSSSDTGTNSANNSWAAVTLALRPIVARIMARHSYWLQ